MLVLAESDGVVNARLASELADVEARFTAELFSDLDCVNRLVDHVEQYRGKMLRPTLVLLTAMATNPQREQTPEAHRVIATVIEMVHMATLVHDDILDEAEMRRRGATINHLRGNEAAVMLGDYLISHAYHLCSTLNRPDISRLIAHATNTVCEGELLQLANRNNWSLDEPTYFEIIRRKTASLCGTCCRLSAMLSNTPEATARAMHLYGEKLGLAFQIVDDLLDLTGDEETVGKTLGRDLQKGKLTLPLIHRLSRVEGSARKELVELLAACGRADGTVSVRADQLTVLRDQLVREESVAYARQWAGKLVESTKRAVVEHLPDSPARALMVEMADTVLNRRF